MSLNLTGGAHPGPLFAERSNRKGVRNRRARDKKIKRATPPWVDMKAIRVLKRMSAYLTAKTGEQHSLDHIVPLCHPLVCGLHVHFNIQVIPLADNLAKSNNYWPDMWGSQMELL